MYEKENISTYSMPLELLMPLIKERLAAGQSICFSPKGDSMLPLLRQNIDSVILSPLPDKLKKYDLPLYQRENGIYVLHRVVDEGNSYTCMGDNQFVPELGIRHEQMIAVVTAFYRGEKLHSVKGPGYWLYCRIWYRSRHLRHFLRRVISWLQRHLI